jgi:hypothetical protein
MTIGTLTQWKDAYALIPLVSTDAWKENLTVYIEDLIVDMNLKTYATPSFTWGRAAFKSALVGAPGAGVSEMQTGFTNSIAASTWLIPSGTTFGGGTLAETFSAPGVAAPDVASVSAGATKIGELESTPPVGTFEDCLFPEILRAAFLLLTYTVTGINSVPPAPFGPINDPLRGVE